MKKSVIIILIGIALLLGMNSRLKVEDNRVYSYEYAGNEGMTQGTLFAKMFGMKKSGSSLLWIRQIVVVGENLGIEDVEKATGDIARGSEKISYLDPYFVGNYQFSGSILAFIRTYRKFEMAFDIFQRGLEYNPNNDILKKYMAGALASSKGNVLEILKVFEEIVAETRDDLLINTLAFTYEQAYNQTDQSAYLEKSLYYWEMLLESKDEKYRNKAIEKLEKYISKST